MYSNELYLRFVSYSDQQSSNKSKRNLFTLKDLRFRRNVRLWSVRRERVHGLAREGRDGVHGRKDQVKVGNRARRLGNADCSMI